MKGLIDIYAQQFKVTMASFIQYRAALVIWLIGHVLEPLIYLVVWSTVSRSTGGEVGGFTAAGFAAYFIVLMIVNHLTYTWIMYEYEYRVRQGTLSPDLLRPVHPIHSDIADNITSKLITLPGMLLIAAAMSLVFRPAFQPVPWAAAAFVPVVLLAFIDSKPEDALAYAQKALELNPSSVRARKGVEWAMGKLKQAQANPEAGLIAGNVGRPSTASLDDEAPR